MQNINSIIEKIDSLIMGEVDENDVMTFNKYLLNKKIGTQVSQLLKHLK